MVNRNFGDVFDTPAVRRAYGRMAGEKSLAVNNIFDPFVPAHQQAALVHWMAEKLGGEQVDSTSLDTGALARDAISPQSAPDRPPATPIDTEQVVKQKLTEQGVFKGHEGLVGLLNADEFWQEQPYGTRLYYGDGYLHRGVLRAAVTALTQPVEVCEWEEFPIDRPEFVVDMSWKAGCRPEFGLPMAPVTSEFEHRFCPYCGKPIREVPYKEES